jgi:CRISPR system Cascade subunit CasA
VGLREVLARAGEISVVEDTSPLVVAAVYRFLLAVLYRALEGPTDIDQARRIFTAGLPDAPISAYLDRWRDRFWLFDASYPFGQNPHVRDGNVEPWTKLTAEYNGSSRKVLFDHTDSRSPGRRSAAECARWLLSTMTFSVGGGRGYYLAPEPNGLFCIPIGRSLGKTLGLNLVQYSNREAARADSALWEREPPALPLTEQKRTPSGLADLYTWPARMVLLEGSAREGIERMRFAPGLGCERSPGSLDPMQAYAEVKGKGRLPVRLRDGRDAWRDFASLLPDPGGDGARTVAHALALIGRGTAQEPMSLLVVGQKNEPPNADLDYWRMDRFVLPEELRGDRLLRRELETLLAEADAAEKALWIACRAFARDSLARGDRDPAKADVAAFVRQMPAIPSYWSKLESAFHDLLDGYVRERTTEELTGEWLGAVRTSLREAWAQQESLVLNEDVWAIRAFAKAERPVRQKLAELGSKIAAPEPKEAA